MNYGLQKLQGAATFTIMTLSITRYIIMKKGRNNEIVFAEKKLSGRYSSIRIIDI
jgi:hypothetical protein